MGYRRANGKYNTKNEDECWRRRSAGATSFCERYVGASCLYLYNSIVNRSLSVVCLVSSSMLKGKYPHAHTCGGGPGVEPIL